MRQLFCNGGKEASEIQIISRKTWEMSSCHVVVCTCNAGLEKEGQESKISLPCWAVLTSLPVFLSGLWASPLLLFSTKDQFEKERPEVQVSCYIPARE